MTDLAFPILGAHAAAQAGDADGLAEHAPVAEGGARRFGHRLYSGVAHRAHAVALLLGDKSAAAIGRYNQAVEIFAALGTRWQLGRTLVGRAEAHASAGHLTSARADYARALEAFEAVGGGGGAAPAHRAPRARPSRLRPRAGGLRGSRGGAGRRPGTPEPAEPALRRVPL